MAARTFVGGLSMRARLTTLTAFVVGLLCITFSAVMLFSLNRMATQNLIRDVSDVGELTAYYVDRGEIIDPLPPIPKNEIRPVQVVDPSGRVVASTADLRGKPPMAGFRPKPPRQTASGEVCDSVFRRCHIVVARQVYRDGDWVVYSAAPVLPFYTYGSALALLIAGTIGFTVAVACATRRTVTSSLRPVDEIRAELDEISGGDVGRRVPIPSAKDEVYRLARSVNHTLDRLEGALQQQRRFTSDASHELRTPIAAIRAQVEDALLAPAETDPIRLCEAVLPSLERLQSITYDLLTLAQLDHGVDLHRQKIDVSELVAAEVRRRHMSSEVVRRLAPGVTVLADRARLAQLLVRLLDNADRHAESCVTVTVRAEPGDPTYGRRFRDGAAVIEVADDGQGIAEHERERVFLRFARVDTARSRGAGGVGLGLPIARRIAEIHGGDLVVADSAKGARLVVRLPLCR
ncbi:HAMP domain-containing histidine kinase [Microbispora sp. RL4-1S]|uniref:histidine kinase n=1 Tax=Microbispora oryzae TaxID=2806554 RepID=A0A941AHU8_9ACTN|nr:HAMP domain-containing sensor histidine kinase [Microbispora oryzae]MBP2704486.1 HAMP domain-containing histidine kinase [Microbispora oryzae]